VFASKAVKIQRSLTQISAVRFSTSIFGPVGRSILPPSLRAQDLKRRSTITLAARYRGLIDGSGLQQPPSSMAALTLAICA
jgi:hypothetical protein